MIKLSILKDGDKYACMEFQNGNNPKVYNNTYGTSGYMDLEDLFLDLLNTYAGEEIILENNL